MQLNDIIDDSSEISPPKKNVGGRPQGRVGLPIAIVKKLGEPPLDDPIKLGDWFTKCGALVMWLMIQGGSQSIDLQKELRAWLAVMSRVIPHAYIYRAQKLLKADAEEIKTGGAPVPLEPVRGGQTRG